MRWHFQIPSKTFVLGEYAVLEGGPCLGAATTPFFEMIFTASGKNHRVMHGIHPESPAGNFLSDHHHSFENLNIQFIDPLSGLGGFGASTAQYLGLWAYRELVLEKKSLETLSQAENIKEMIHEYRNFSTRRQGRAPSGADLVTQLCGGLSWIETSSWEVQKVSWPWPELMGFFLATGNKIATHTHLQDLSDFNPSELFRILQQSRSDLKSKNSQSWLDAINEYFQALDLLQLVAAETKRLLEQMREIPGVKAVKGCGAMGADVIFCVLDSQSQNFFRQYAQKNKLRIIASTKDFSSGLKLMSETSFDERELSRD